MKIQAMFPGILLIILGIIFLLPNFTSLQWQGIWPLFVLLPGVWFLVLYFTDRTKEGLLIPAAVLTVSGGVMLYCALTSWTAMADLWPLFIMAPGIGFLLMYVLGKKEAGLLVPAGILILLGLFFYLGDSFGEYFLPVLLIILGLYLLLRGRIRRKGAATDPPPAA